MTLTFNPNRKILRHMVATLVYRLSNAISDVPERYPLFKIGSKSRTPIEILKHINDLIEWAHAVTLGKNAPSTPTANDWSSAVSHFYNSIREFDNYLAGNNLIACPIEKLLQGPITDALTHVGQLAMLRRLAGSAVKGESYFDADIVIGRVGPDQSMPRKVFD